MLLHRCSFLGFFFVGEVLGAFEDGLARFCELAGSLTSGVEAWSLSDGSSGFSRAQTEYIEPFVNLVREIELSSPGIVQDNLTTEFQGTFCLVTHIPLVLDLLSSKAQAITSVGAASIVKSDISDLYNHLMPLYVTLFSAVTDRGLYETIAFRFTDITSAFNQAIAAYGASSVEYPDIPAHYS